MRSSLSAPWSTDPGDSLRVDPIVDEVERRVLDRLSDWMGTGLDEHVLRLVEERLEAETERRAWRSGVEVF